MVDALVMVTCTCCLSPKTSSYNLRNPHDIIYQCSKCKLVYCQKCMVKWSARQVNPNAMICKGCVLSMSEIDLLEVEGLTDYGKKRLKTPCCTRRAIGLLQNIILSKDVKIDMLQGLKDISDHCKELNLD